MRRSLAIIAAATAGLALAQGAQQTLQLIVNGRPAVTRAIIVSGKTYVPLDALNAAGVTSNRSGTTLTLTVPAAQQAAAGGANGVTAVEGCINETLFNGVWRFRVTRLDALTGEPRGYSVGLEFRNGTNRAQTLGGTGAAGALMEADNFSLALADGSTITPGGSILDLQAFATRSVPQGGSLAYTLRFLVPEGAPAPAKATKLVVAIPRSGAAYTVPDPSFRVRLDCNR
ncbi:MAG TPA: hypothetical protein VNT60_10185 [Deinococcales bacterium]|nr:hypothetical protein [Deinococcales bacterium]